MLKLGVGVFGTAGAPMFPLDLMAFGAVKRNISTARAFHMMIESWNMVCARSLLRIHIDTSLRFSAAWLVEKPHEFATHVLKGERIDKMKDKDGKRLSDAHLVEVRSPEYPWLPAVYKNLSGYVHFSGSHIYDSVANVGDEDNTISFEVSDTDLKFPEFSWVEILECFREATAILAKFLHGYVLTKQLSPAELEAARRQLTLPSSGQPPASR
ncbi:MAG TPA: hypothetical protein VHE58_08905 [Burkholderiales bacterium]|nr:hypothetical protein [Burkholderiales bacterium]